MRGMSDWQRVKERTDEWDVVVWRWIAQRRGTKRREDCRGLGG